MVKSGSFTLDGPVAIFLFEDDFSNLDVLGEKRKVAEELLGLENFKGKEESLVKVHLPVDGKGFIPLYAVGLGKKDKTSLDSYRVAGALLVKRLKRDKVSSVCVYVGESLDYKLSKAITEGVLLGSYSFDKYKTKKEEEGVKVEKVTLHGADEEGIRVGSIFAEAQNFARDLVNEPGNVINPITLAEIAQKLAQEYGLECTIYDEKQIQEMGMNALWSVGKGSATPPRFIHLVYRPQGEPKEKIALVGKGLTFDSGGLNIKTGDYMRTMKMDKSGACAVLGIMKALAELKPQVEVHGLIGAAENMPSGTAYRPDDIIVALNGKTIEIDNTDAEGRVTLADVLSYASRLKPSKIVDMATLTGACIVALGEYTAGLFTNDDEFGDEILRLSKETGERMWKLPMDDKRLRKKIKKGEADVLNSGGRYGGAITAAMFLEEFVDEGIKWVHLDIAGPAYTKEEYGYYSKGATGFGVRTLLEYILSL
ncbi:leucyl aminopeptidase [Thermocrinis minervae]|uniref:Probable cytosol aminopeptidase n=1 Tax=Thermocrinis minervae TaxID=381751 RepID=A0A1M6SSK1_9AQUI|nr:leucyl aminopeptidase [Thermocrinis minervae]SHK47712.1 leucyl aminopeptidase [Thermocrinis minervae]